MKNTTNPDLLRTAKLPACTMRDLVYPRAAKRFPLPTRLIFLAAFLGATIGCATGRPVTADAPETVGNLSASYHSVAVAPVHASTDLTPSFGAIDTDEDAAAPVTVSAQADAGGDAEAPAPVEKAAHGF